MKKATLLLLGASLAVGVQAQQLRQRSVVMSSTAEATRAVPQKATVKGTPASTINHNTAAKGALTAFYTQTFAGSIPTGWSTASLTTGIPSMWRWANAAPTGSGNPYPLPAIASTTASNGWMLCNADSIGTAFPNAAPVESVLTSAVISCTGHPSVQISFQENFVRFVDSCFIDVSSNGGTSYTSFPVTINNATATNSYVGPNPTTVSMNISSVAANQANVRIRFRYKYLQAGGAYNWDVDDMTLSELDPTEVGIESSGVVFTQGTRNGFSANRSMPIQLVDSVFPVTYLSNLGANAQTNVAVSVKIFNPSNAQVYSQTQTYAALPVSATDSLIGFPNTPSYKPTVIGRYMVAFSVNQTGDALASNNVDTSYFYITDSTYNAYGFKSAGGYIIHSIVNGNTPSRSFTQGIVVEVPGNFKDTITSIGINLNSGSTPGAVIQGQLYKFNAATSQWASRGRTVQHTISSADLSTTSTVFTDLVFMPVSGNIAPFVLDSGSYAIVVGAIGATSSQVVTVNAASNTFTHVTDFVGSTGVSDTSLNSSSYNFGVNGLPNGLGSVPIVSAYFGNNARRTLLTVSDIPGVIIGNVFPNPANTFVNIPVTVKESTEVTITISNVMGQTVRTQDMGTIGANNTNVASIRTTDLANGVYIYTINANGGRAAGRIVVSH